MKRYFVTGFFLLVIHGFLAAQPVLDAAAKGDLEAVSALVDENPALLFLTDDEETSFLHYAAFGGNREVVELALKAGAEVNSVNISGETPIHYAAYKGAEPIIAILLEKGALLNRGNIEKAAPLHYAAMMGHSGAVRLLVEKGAEVNGEDFYNQTPLETARDSKRDETAAYLLSVGGKTTYVREADLKPMGKHLTRILFPYGRASNIALFSGREGNLLIDTGFTPRTIDKLKAILDQTGNPELKYLVNTHLHPDHIAGNAIAGENTVIIDFNNLEKMAADGILSLGKGKLTGKNGLQFDLYYVLNFNGEEIRLIPYPGIHTNEDILIHFTRSGVVHTGDLLISQSFPSVRSRVDDYLQFLKKLTDVFPEDTRFICGHGRECNMDDVRNYLTMLTDATAIIRSYINAGKGKKDIRKEGALSAYDSWGEFIPQLDYNYWMNAVYRSEAEKNK